ncbi:MAG TPA: globin domain-containing protein [Gemmatimonadaceae bacterium]|jgi:hemoglobin-like flavoprotein|nr:globin domain-containing protein [Gemmatimonadaceae bacterium]
MTPDQVQLLTESWERVKGRGDELLLRFYEHLFALDPTAHALFGSTNMAAQRQKFAGMVDAILALRQEPRQFVRSAVELGCRHQQYGVRADQYETAGTALLLALRDVLGPELTPAHRDAWISGYKLVAAIMLRATRLRAEGPGRAMGAARARSDSPA